MYRVRRYCKDYFGDECIMCEGNVDFRHEDNHDASGEASMTFK